MKTVEQPTDEKRRATREGLVRPAHQLDATDMRILTVLQSHGRMANVELSAHSRLSAPPTLRRTRTLEDRGYIRGYYAKLDGAKLGFSVTAFVLVGLTTQSMFDVKSFEQQVARWPSIRECYAVSGHADFILKCVAHNLAEFQDFVTGTLMTLPNVKTVKSALTVRSVKDDPGIPLAFRELRSCNRDPALTETNP